MIVVIPASGLPGATTVHAKAITTATAIADGGGGGLITVAVFNARAEIGAQDTPVTVRSFVDEGATLTVGSLLVEALGTGTAFANTTGEMTIPVLVTGTFKQPRFSPDTQSIVQLQKQKLIPGFQPGQKPADTVKGILGGLFGGKK